MTRFVATCPRRQSTGFLSAARAAGAAVMLGLLGVLAARGDERIDSVMFQDPLLPTSQHAVEVPEEVLALWQQALQQDEAELHILVANSTSLAYEAGLQSARRLAGTFAALLTDEQRPDAVRRAAARALVTLDAREHAAPLAHWATQRGPDDSLIVEPTLARWKDATLQEAWRQRLTQPLRNPLRTGLALTGLAALGDVQSVNTMLALAADRSLPYSLQVKAAAAAAVVSPSMARELAAQKARAPRRADRLLALQLLAHVDDALALELLRTLATDVEPTVQYAALQRLLAINPSHLQPFAQTALAHADSNVRGVAVGYFIGAADRDAVARLTAVMNDPMPELRRQASNAWIAFAAQTELRPVVLGELDHVLSSDRWRELEQALIVAGTLDHEPAAPRCVELFEHPRPEVNVAAAWALRKLAVRDTLPALLARAEQLYARLESLKEKQFPYVVSEISQLFQALGPLQYAEAEPLMRKFVPKRMELGEASRAAACWGLGCLHEGQPVDDLTEQFAARLRDLNPMNPELEMVRRMSAIAIGRMRAEQGTAVLRQFAGPGAETTEVGQACFWSLHQMTGEPIPSPGKYRHKRMGWFLVPNDGTEQPPAP